MTTDPDTNVKSTSSVSRSPKAEALLGSAPAEQIAAAIAAEKWARAAGLLELHGERLLLDGDVHALAGWLEALPDDHITRHVKLAALFGWVRIYDQRYQDALVFLSKAERALQQMRLGGGHSSDEIVLRPFADIEQSLTAIRMHLQAVTGAAGKLPEHVEDIMLPASGDHPLWRAAALVSLGRTRYVAGDLRAAADDLEAAHTLASTSRGPRAVRIAADAGVLLGRIAEARGKLDVATRHYEAIVAASDNALAAEVGLARVALLRLDPAAARQRLERVAQAIADGNNLVDPVRVVFEGELARATLQLVEGAPDDARATLDQLDKTLAALKLRWPIDLINAGRARAALIKKDESLARRWLQQYTMRGDNKPASNPLAANDRITAALTHIALHDPAAGLKAAQDALAFAEATGNKVVALEAQVALVLGHYAAGARDEARSAMMAVLEGTKATGVLAPLFVRGLEAVASELELDAEAIVDVVRAARRLPPLPPRADRNERPSAPLGAKSGPIETSRVAPTPAVAGAPEAAAEVVPEDGAEVVPEDGDEGVAAEAGRAEGAPL